MAQVNIKIDDQLKDDVSKIFADMGLDITSGIKVYLKRVQQDHKIPFEVRSQSPSFDADQVVKDYQDGDPTVVNSLNSLFKSLGKLQQSDSSDNSIGGSILKTFRD